MAVALRVAIFRNATELANFAADAANNVTTIVAITYEMNVGWVLHYS